MAAQSDKLSWLPQTKHFSFAAENQSFRSCATIINVFCHGVEFRPAALKVLGSNPSWGAQELKKLTFISRNSAAMQPNSIEGALY